ncbi:MAG: carbon storage regulator [Legionella sp.]|nr:carbon storage regulator [Legionella sp.]
MLLLTRRKGQQILIDKGQIQIEVIYVRKGSVALGIKAPPHIDIDRKEIFFKRLTNLEKIDTKEAE